MEDEETFEILLAADGAPILDQFSEEGFVDCAFRITNLEALPGKYRFHILSNHVGELVGFDVEVVSEIRGAFQGDFDLISEHVYRRGVTFRRSGPESDRMIAVLTELYGREPSRSARMVDSFSFTGIALHHDDVDMESDTIRIKLFGNDGIDCPEDDYFESSFNLDLFNGFVFWNEKDPDYRDAMLRGLLSKR